MLTEEIVRSLLAGYFEKNNLELYSVLPANAGSERIMIIEFGCDQGIYHMEMYEDLRLFCEDRTRRKWVQIKEYGREGE